MKSVIRQLRSAPVRVLATILSLALALAALGVFAVPAVSTATLRDAAVTDNLAHLTAPTAPLEDVSDLAGISGLAELEGRIQQTVALRSGQSAPLVGLDFDTQAVNLVTTEQGRFPEGPLEVVAHADLAELGEEITLNDQTVEVVGIGSTSARSEEPAFFGSNETAVAVTGVEDANLVLLRLDSTSDDELATAVVELRDAVAAEGSALTALPATRAEGTHPIDEDLATISMMIGGLGIVAGLVALILLASTTNTLISERSQEAAVLRALGSRRRPLRRSLRRVAIVMAAVGALIGIPLGILLSNVIARMVLVKFVGLTPGIAIAWPVVIGSAVFAVLGARIAAGHAARRLTKVPLADALRDHNGAPFGRRWSDRALSKLPTAGLTTRMALRNTARRRARSFGVAAQAAAAVAAVVIVASMYTSVQSFDEAETEPWNWQTMTSPADPGLPYDATTGQGDPGIESAIYSDARLGAWEIEVFGLEKDTLMLDTAVEEGTWLSNSSAAMNEAVITEGFAEFENIQIGDEITVDLITGPTEYRVVGTHPYRSRSIFVERDALAVDLGSPARANVVWSLTAAPTEQLSPGLSDTVTQAQATAEDRAARAAIVYIFTAIGVIVVAVAVLSLSSTLLVNLHERRHELAALRSIGGRGAQLRRLLAVETLPLVLVGWAVGIAAGWAGAAALIAMFEAADAVRIGFVFAGAAVPVTATATALGALALTYVATRTTTRHTPAAVLRTTT